MAETNYASLLWRTLAVVAVCAAAVVVCYFWVDRPVAFFVHDQGVEKVRFFKWLTYPPPFVQSWSPLVLALIMARRAWGPLPPCLWALFVACLSLIVADQFRTSLGDVAGRYWPETWHDDNPSLIGTGAYGFHPFRLGDDVGSFPSGHSARIAGFAGVWWLAMPRLRLLLVLICGPMVASLVAMNYHFVGDCVAGVTLGGVVAVYAARLAGIASDDASPASTEPSARDQ